MNPRHFFAEMKRRNVYKVAVAYAVVAAHSNRHAGFSVLRNTEPAARLAVLLLILGLPMALRVVSVFM